MALFGIVFLFVALVLIGIGIAIGTIAFLVTAVLVGMGVVSSSFLIALRSGRPSAGIRAFLLQCGILAGIPAGAICAWLGEHFLAAMGSDLPVLLYGAMGGALAGVTVAFMLDVISVRIGAWTAARVQSLRSPYPQPLEKGV